MSGIDFNVAGKVAVITGAGGIICGVMAKEMAKAGMKVAVLDLFEEKAGQIADEIRSAGVNGAGGNKKEASTSPELSFFDMPLDALKWVFDLNVMGAVLTTQVFGEEIVKTEGSVINIASMSSFHPLTNTVAYSGAKAAVANFTQWLAVHFNQNYSQKMRVNAIAPGFLLTEQNRYLLTKEDGSATQRGEKVLDKTPMGRYGAPEEMVGAVLWLCSDAASFVNGAVIPIDGGFSAYWGV